MQNTVSSVYEYYWQNLSILSKSAEFHFIHRLSALTHDSKAVSEIGKLQAKYSTASNEEVWQFLKERVYSSGPVAYAGDRAQYYEKYPLVRPGYAEMIMTVFAEELFKKDLRYMMSYSADEIRQEKDRLLQDDEAMKQLYASAINFVLVAENFLNKNNESQLVYDLFDRSHRYYKTDASPRELEMWIYYVTHLIICDSMYYSWKLPEEKQKLYKDMLLEIEAAITTHFFWGHLDYKCEFIVCCNMLNYQSNLAPIIYSEAECSVSPKGNFLVDTLNAHRQDFRSDFESSEHRNVLYLVAFHDRIGSK